MHLNSHVLATLRAAAALSTLAIAAPALAGELPTETVQANNAANYETEVLAFVITTPPIEVEPIDWSADPCPPCGRG